MQQGRVLWCFGVVLCEADVRHWWSWMALKRLYDTGMRLIVQPCWQNFGEELVLMDNSRPHRAHLVNEFLHDNIVKTRVASMFSRHEPYRTCLGYIEKGCFWTRWATNHSETSMPNRRWGVGQSGPTRPWWTSGQYATTNTGMHQCKRMCYWVLEALVYAATWNPNSESLAVLLYNLQFLVFMSNSESWNVVFVYLYSICM